MVIKKTTSWLSATIVNSAASFLYAIGLTLGIPLFLFIVFSPTEITGRFVASAIFAGLVIISAVAILYAWTGSLRETLLRMSYFTLIPAGIAIVLNFYSLEVFYATAETLIADFEIVEPLINSYIEQRVPKLTPLIIGYVVIGITLLITALKMKKDEL